MKKFIFLFLGLSGYSTAFTQNVGINNIAPTYPLDILKTGGGSFIRMVNPSNNTGATSGLLFTNSASYSSTPFFSASIHAERQAAGGNAIIFSTNQTSGVPLERMRIDSFGNVLLNNGNIGLGLTSSAYDLYVYRNDPSIAFYDLNDNHFSGYIIGDSNDLMINAYRRNLVGTNESGHLLLQVSSGSPLPFVSGNVGIGTSVPSAKLHVGSNVMIGTGSPAQGFLLSVNGKIISTEVKVQMQTSWPDYVFSKDYKLRTIDQLEGFIKQNSHLPGIPAASVVQQNGIELGDMSKRLIEKVEELTLYIIQLNKELKEAKERLQLLENKKQ